MNERLEPTENEAALSDLFASLDAVAQAGIEHGQEDTVVLDLPEDTIVRASEIYRQDTSD